MNVVAIRTDWWTDGTREMYAEYHVGKPSMDVMVFNGEEQYNTDDSGITVTKIEYHHSQHKGDRHYADVTFSNGLKTREFNLNSVIYYGECE